MEWYAVAADKGHTGAQFQLGKIFREGLGVPVDKKAARMWLLKAADQGVSSAMEMLKQMSEAPVLAAEGSNAAVAVNPASSPATVTAAATGNDGQPRTQQPVHETRKQAQGGDAQAQYQLGLAYLEGVNRLPRDAAEARIWLQRAASQGHMDAQYELGRLLLNFTKVDDHQQAKQWLTKSSSAGNVKAAYVLGNMFRQGKGVAKDHKVALSWYLKAADGGSPQAQYMLGDIYYTGIGLARDTGKALMWLKRSANAGFKIAQIKLAEILLSQAQGEDQAGKWEAIKWMTKAADSGDVNAQYKLGYLFYTGESIGRDFQQAAKWLRAAAGKGHAQSQTLLGSLYEKGAGVGKDYHEAIRWYRKAADSNHAEAQYLLAAAYENGRGVDVDLIAASMWYQRAANQGHEKARRRLDEISKRGLSSNS